jgi:hypothetical protein
LAPVDEARAERLVLQAAKVIYGGFDNWEVRGIRNLRIGVPLGGLTVDVVTVSDDGEVLVLEGVWDGALWIDRVVQESREDAKKGGKGGKRQPRKEKPKCTKGRVCGMTCIRRTKANGEPTSCRFDPPPLVEQALNTASSIGASSGGGGAGGGQGYPTSLPADHVVTTNKRITSARLDKALDAIDSPGAKERVGMLRAFVEKTGVQTVFADPSVSMTDHLAAVDRGLKDKDFAAIDGGLLRNTKADPNAAGYTSFAWNHIVVTSDSKGRTGPFKASSEKLRQGADRIFEANAEDELIRDIMTFPSAVAGTVRDRDSFEMVTYLHEMGHQIHAKAGLPDVPIDIKGSATTYGAEDEQEWVAEHFGLWMLDAQRYEQLDPSGAQFIREMLVQATESPFSYEDLRAGKRRK